MKYTLNAALLLGTTSAFITGANIGGWLVLEPWITPSLFYRFLGKGQGQTAMDSWTFCESLGPQEGNRVMRAHWKTWITENDIQALAARHVTMVRLPIGDWTLDPYGPYVGCMDGADQQISWILDTAQKHGIKVWMDVHTAKGSQNGFDNGGRSWRINWRDNMHYTHSGAAEWIGPWDDANQKYKSIDTANIQRTISHSEALLKRYGSHPAFAAFEPVNEPWWNTPLTPLKDMYRAVRPLVQKYAPNAKFVFHDSFRYDPNIWNDLFADNDIHNVVLDHHYYWAFEDYVHDITTACNDAKYFTGLADQIKYEVWFGEWSLATDNCAQHLNGFNDGTPNKFYTCAQVDCPRSYLPDGVATDFDRSAAMLGPFGNSDNTRNAIQKGKCFSDSDYFSWTQVK